MNMPFVFYNVMGGDTMKLFVRKSLLLLIFWVSIGGVVLAETAYLTDHSSYRVRSGKGGTYEVVSAVYAGDKVEVLAKEDGWAKIRLPNGKVGWILDRYLIFTPPAKLRVETLNDENKGLRRELAKTEEELHALREVKARYDELIKKPDEAVELRAEKERLEKDLEVHKTLMENMQADLWERDIKLFVFGAGILFFGILIGFVMKKKSRRSYY